MPIGILRLEQISAEDMKAISGINPDLLGLQDKTASGIAINLRQRQGVTILASIFDNLKMSMEQMGRVLMSRIRQFCPEEKMARILGRRRLENDPELIEKLKSKEVHEYDLIVTQMPSSPSLRIENFLKVMEMRKAGIAIPDDVILELSDIPQAQDVVKRLRELRNIAMQNITGAGPSEPAQIPEQTAGGPVSSANTEATPSVVANTGATP